jgi:hypothetical protein
MIMLYRAIIITVLPGTTAMVISCFTPLGSGGAHSQLQNSYYGNCARRGIVLERDSPITRRDSPIR